MNPTTLLALLSLISLAAKAEMQLVVDGKAMVVIVTSDRPSAVASYAAGEFGGFGVGFEHG